MAYFSNVKEGDNVYGFVFGKGKVIKVLPDGWYKFLVEFENGSVVPYTEDGIPGWGVFDEQTLFYEKDINEEIRKKFDDGDLLPSDMLTLKDIIVLREKGELEVRCPSGVWVDYRKCPSDYLIRLYENEKYDHFRKKRGNKND